MTDIIMVKGRTSNRVGDALSRMLEATKPVQAEHTATAGEPVNSPAPAPHPIPQSPRSYQSIPGGSTPAGGDPTPPSLSPPAPLSLEWDQEEIRIDYALEQISEFEAIRALTQTGMNVCEAMDYLESWE